MTAHNTQATQAAEHEVVLDKAKAVDALLLMGQLAAARELQERLEDFQRRYPAAVGLELAVSQVLLVAATTRQELSHTVLGAAAKHGLLIDGHVIRSGVRGDDVVVTSTRDAAAQEAAA